MQETLSIPPVHGGTLLHDSVIIKCGRESRQAGKSASQIEIGSGPTEGMGWSLAVEARGID